MDSLRKGAVLVLLLSFSLAVLAHSGYYHSYSKSCPNVERIIKETLTTHANWDRTIPAGVLRLHFHDCFVDGCDGSVLLESTPTDGDKVERKATQNLKSARGFEVINDAKERLEAACPGVVSCADTLAIAARDSSVMLGGKYYQVRTGRYDGRVSSLQHANASLPFGFQGASELIQNFKNQGMSVQDLVILSGGHTLGTANCLVLQDRLYNFSKTGRPDPTINPEYLSRLRNMCPKGSGTGRVEFDRGSQFAFDNSFYKNLVKRNGIITSDQVLNEDSRTSAYVKHLAYNQHDFLSQFAASMVKMGDIEWKNQYNGEIRTVCSMVNPEIGYGGRHRSPST